MEWYEQNKTFGNLGPAERTRKQDPGLDRIQEQSSAARADRGDAVKEPERNNCQSLNAGCGSPAVFFFSRANAARQVEKRVQESMHRAIHAKNERMHRAIHATVPTAAVQPEVAFLRTTQENYLLHACMLLLQKVEVQTRALLRINIASQG